MPSFAVIVVALAGLAVPVITLAQTAPPRWRSPVAICAQQDGVRAFVVNQTSDSVTVLDVRGRAVVGEIPVGRHPTHCALTADSATLYVSATWEGAVHEVDVVEQRVLRRFDGGKEPWGLALVDDERLLLVAASLDDAVRVVDLTTGRGEAVPVGRSPRFIERIPGGTTALVTNGLGRTASIVDWRARRQLEERALGRASLLRQVVVAPSGRWGAVAHVISHDETPTLQPERGWIHSNGLSVLALDTSGRFVTLLLDRLLDGAANPWGMALSPDGRRLFVTLAGVHEVAVVDVERALALVEWTAPELVEALAQDVEVVERERVARRVPAHGKGPRGLAVVGGEVLVANHWSDTVTVLDAETGALRATISLGPTPPMTPKREGEILFNDAGLNYQRWFSCASCHEEDATTDGLNWDLQNDGVGNPKNAKSLHDAFDTPPNMWAGVRADGDAATAAGQRFLGFLPDPMKHPLLVAYLKTARRAPNPWRGVNPPAEERGAKVYEDAGCGECHPAPLYTDLRLHDLGMRTPTDLHDAYDTPSLRDTYRTAPYLHDGRAPTLRSLFTEHNPNDRHGHTSGLTDDQLDDLVVYLRTL